MVRHGCRLLMVGTVLTLALAVPPAHAGFPGDNGRIALQGFQKIDTVNADGGDPQPVAGEFNRLFSGPAWSADGKRLAWASNKDTAGGPAEIYVSSPTGTGATRVTTNGGDDFAPSWSPDGTRLAFSSTMDTGVGQIYTINADGTGLLRLTNNVFSDQAPAWSPDGTRIAFNRGPDGGPYNIWWIPAGGGAGTQLTFDAGDESNPDWSPDGTRIVYQTDAGLATMGADGSGQAAVPGGGVGAARPAWSPDGSQLVYDRGSEVFKSNVDGSGQLQLTISGGAATVYSNANWQPIPRPAPPPGGGGGGGGGGPVDADGDGSLAGADCDDANAAIRPGATDNPRDGIDQDCNGRDARFRVIERSIAGFWATYSGPYTKFTALTVKPARKGDTVRLTCKGPGCNVKRKTVKVKKNARSLSMLKHLKGSKLRKSAVVRLRVTRPGTIGLVSTWTIRAPKSPKLVRRCVQPGAKKLSRCP